MLENEECDNTHEDIVGTPPGESGRASDPRNVFGPPTLIVLRIFGPLNSNVI